VGIILARYVDSPLFDSHVQTLYQQAEARQKLSPSNELIVIEKTIKFLKDKDIKVVLG
jgi:hypothetical protein